jgi:hypothetical protein
MAGRMVGTIVIRVEIGPALFELSRVCSCTLRTMASSNSAARHTGLVGDEDRASPHD